VVASFFQILPPPPSLASFPPQHGAISDGCFLPLWFSHGLFPRSAFTFSQSASPSTFSRESLEDPSAHKPLPVCRGVDFFSFHTSTVPKSFSLFPTLIVFSPWSPQSFFFPGQATRPFAENPPTPSNLDEPVSRSLFHSPSVHPPPTPKETSFVRFSPLFVMGLALCVYRSAPSPAPEILRQTIGQFNFPLFFNESGAKVPPLPFFF